MTPDGELPQAETPEVPQAPQLTDAEFRQQRIREMLDMDVFMGPPYGRRHGDAWSIGGVQPRWPVVNEPPPDISGGEVIAMYTINWETGEITHEPLPPADPPAEEEKPVD